MGTTTDLTNLSLQIAFGITGMVLLTTFIIIFFIIYQRRLYQQQLEHQKMEANQQRRLLNAGILAQEEERKRIATELHDSIGGLLSATKIYVSNVSMEQSQEQFLLFKKKALEALNENIGEVRNITNNLLPQSLERLGIVTATRSLTQKLIDLNHIEVDFHANAEKRFKKDREKALFRILQELINNTLKHSNAKKVLVHFHFTSEQLVVFYNDNGEGFDRDAYKNKKDSKSFGLKNIESRMAFLGGTLDYQTALGKGVEVQLTVPIHHSNLALNIHEDQNQNSISR